MPCLSDEFPIVRNDPQYIAKLAGIEAVAFGDRDIGLNPDFGVASASLDMNMCSSRGEPSFE